MMDGLYRDKLLSHYHAPKNYGLMEDFDVEAKGENPLCGDSITVRLKLKGSRISEISFENKGCVISRAAASLLFEDIKGKTGEMIRSLTFSSIIGLLEVEPMPARIKCALLPLETIQKAV